jgi:hypothetical protein
MGRRQYTFDEPAAKCVVTIDTTFKPRKTFPLPIPRATPKADALAQIVAEYVARECSDEREAA